MKRPARNLVATALTLLSGLAAAEARASWRHSPIWDDGNAEYCVYEVAWSRYGRLYQGRASVILVKEPWAPDLEVKADHPRSDGFDVIKLNHVRHVQTGIYAYHQMASAFLRRESGELRKLSTSSAEACGISTAHMIDGRLNTRSYFDGQGEGELPFPEGVVPEDALPAVLRDYVEGEAPDALQIFPSLMSGRFSRLESRELELSRERLELDTAMGRLDAVEIRLAGSGGGRWVFAAESPHALLLVERNDRTTYTLAKCERIPYWSMAGPGGEGWLPESVSP
jgi:hypothetical protein